MLGDFAEAIWDADFDDARSARALTIKVLPTTSLVLIVHYRAAMTAAHRPRYKRTANGMQTRAMTMRPSGPLGVVLVRLKAEEACRVLGCDLADITDASVELSDIFGDREASLLEEMLAEAENAEARVARMRQFLRGRVAANRSDPVVYRAVRALRADPAVSMRDLARVRRRRTQSAAPLKTLTGVSPKQNARVARMEKVVAAQLKGSDGPTSPMRPATTNRRSDQRFQVVGWRAARHVLSRHDGCGISRLECRTRSVGFLQYIHDLAH